MNRDAMRALIVAARASGEFQGEDWDPDAPMDDGNPMGTPESEIHLQVDVSPYIDQRRRALACHRSQATDIEMFLAMPPEAFAAVFSREHYIEPGAEPGMREGWIFDQGS
jgi:LmbE family N-acetylglucosaminyl deacetylase